MVEIEEIWKGRYGIWIDGNEPSATGVRYMTMRPGLDGLGISEELRRKHDLHDYRIKAKMHKEELWRSVLAAQVEQELIDAGVDSEEFDGLFIKPQSARGEFLNSYIAQGVKSNLRRKRVTYSQTVISVPEKYEKEARITLHSALQKLSFKFSTPENYIDYNMFEKECRVFLHEILERDKETYQQISQRTGVKIYSILP